MQEADFRRHQPFAAATKARDLLRRHDRRLRSRSTTYGHGMLGRESAERGDVACKSVGGAAGGGDRRRLCGGRLVVDHEMAGRPAGAALRELAQGVAADRIGRRRGVADQRDRDRPVLAIVGDLADVAPAFWSMSETLSLLTWINCKLFARPAMLNVAGHWSLHRS